MNHRPHPKPKGLYWRLNVFGIVVYLVITCWLIGASTYTLTEILSGDSEIELWRPVTGFILGLLALAGIGWGRVHDWEDHDD